MSENWVEPGWWYASDGKWYPPLDGDTSTTQLSSDSSQPGGVASVTNEDGDFADSDDPNPSEIDLTGSEEAVHEDVAPKPFTFSVAREPETIDLKGIEQRLARQAAEQVKVPVGGVSPSASTSASASTPPAESEAPTAVSGPSTVIQRADGDRPASVTRTTVGPAVGSQGENESDEPNTSPPVNPVVDEAHAAEPSEPESAGDSLSGEGAEPLPTAVDRGGEEFWDEGSSGRSVRETPLLVAAVCLAIVCGILGALWLRERSAASDLRAETAAVDVVDLSAEVEALEGENNTLRLQNEQLEQQLTEMSALVLELPEGRVTEIDVPFTPVFADEENGRLIAMDSSGEYVVFGDGVESPITDSGSVGAAPTGLFAATAKAWVSTEAGQIDILAMSPGAQPQESVEYGPVSFLAADERGYWTYNAELGQVVRLRKSDGGQTAAAAVPVEVVDLALGAGSVWALGEDGRVYRINTADLTVQAIDAGEDLISITAGPDALWTLSAADGSLRRIDPVTGAVLVTVPVGRDPIDATFAGSSVWVALRVGSSLIEVDTRTSAVVSRTELSSEPTALYEGDSGVFVTTVGDGAPLLRIDSLVDNANNADGTSVDGTTDDDS